MEIYSLCPLCILGELMVTDLMESHLKEGMTYNEIFELLGPSKNNFEHDPNTICYETSIIYKKYINLKKGENLYIQFRADSVVEKFWVKEVKKRFIKISKIK